MAWGGEAPPMAEEEAQADDETMDFARQRSI